MPSREHQDFQWALETWLELNWAGPKGNRVHHEVNLTSPGGRPEKDYRIPDLVLLTPDRFAIDHDEYFEGAPTVVVEIRSPGDESYEKLPFYASMGVPEVWIIDRDTKAPEVYVLSGNDYGAKTPDEDGWIRSQATGIALCQQSAGSLAVQIAEDPSTLRVLSAKRSIRPL
jgi:Uma2 family endonuclease